MTKCLFKRGARRVKRVPFRDSSTGLADEGSPESRQATISLCGRQGFFPGNPQIKRATARPALPRLASCRAHEPPAGLPGRLLSGAHIPENRMEYVGRSVWSHDDRKRLNAGTGPPVPREFTCLCRRAAPASHRAGLHAGPRASSRGPISSFPAAQFLSVRSSS